MHESVARFSRLPCPRCRLRTYRGLVACRVTCLGYYDVGAAEALVRRLRRRAQPVTPFDLRVIFNSDVHPPHLAHVDTRRPGILGLAWIRGRLTRFILEGNHRSARAIQAGRPFRLYRLTEAETASVFIGRRPPPGKCWVGPG